MNDTYDDLRGNHEMLIDAISRMRRTAEITEKMQSINTLFEEFDEMLDESHNSYDELKKKFLEIEAEIEGKCK